MHKRASYGWDNRSGKEIFGHAKKFKLTMNDLSGFARTIPSQVLSLMKYNDPYELERHKSDIQSSFGSLNSFLGE
jgi:hypothetical protein